MNKFVAVLLLFSNLAMADCDWTKIVVNTDGSRTYSKELHICVGQMKQDLDTAQKQVGDLTQAIQLKDLAITKSDARATLWQDTSFKLEDRIQTISKMESTNNWIYYGLGAITVLGAGFMAAKLMHP